MPSSLLNHIPASSNRFLSDFSNDTISYQWKNVRNGKQEETLPTRSCPLSFGSISISCPQSFLSEKRIPYSISETICWKCIPHVNVLHLNTEFSLSNYALDCLKKSWTSFCYEKAQYSKMSLMKTVHKKQNMGYKFSQSLHRILKQVRQYLQIYL